MDEATKVTGIDGRETWRGLIRHPSGPRLSCFLPAIPRLVTSHLPRRSFRVLVRLEPSWLDPSRLIKYSFSSGRPNPRSPRWDGGNRDRQINQKRNGAEGEPIRPEQYPLPGRQTLVADVISGRACPR